MKKLLDKKEYNLKMKKYRDDNKFLNSYHCHNYKRREKGYQAISVIEYLEYRKFIKINLVFKLKSSRFSNFDKWENYKKENGLFFTAPLSKGNFTLKIKKIIKKEFE